MAKSERRREVEAKILRITRDDYKRLGEIAEALKMPLNTVRAKYLYPMANEGLLKRRFSTKTSVQAYKAR
jgi:hypothetical protein